MIVLENHPNGVTVFVVCSDCGARSIQGTSGQSNILRHKKSCDDKVNPTWSQLSGKEVAPVAPRAKEEKYDYEKHLRQTGHSWRDINSGNTDF